MREAIGGRLMVVEYIRYTIDEERARDFAEAYRQAAAALEASEH